MRYQRFVILIFITAAVLMGITVQAGVQSAFAQFSVADTRFLGLLPLSSSLAVLSSAVTFGVLIRNQQAVPFTHEVVEQLVKVSWPEKDETVKGAITVVATAAFTAALLGVYDFVWRNAAAVVLATDTVKNGTT